MLIVSVMTDQIEELSARKVCGVHVMPTWSIRVTTKGGERIKSGLKVTPSLSISIETFSVIADVGHESALKSFGGVASPLSQINGRVETLVCLLDAEAFRVKVSAHVERAVILKELLGEHARRNVVVRILLSCGVSDSKAPFGT